MNEKKNLTAKETFVKGGLGKNIPVKTLSRKKLSQGIDIIELILFCIFIVLSSFEKTKNILSLGIIFLIEFMSYSKLLDIVLKNEILVFSLRSNIIKT